MRFITRILGALIVAALMLAPASSGGDLPCEWKAGDEAAKLNGHTFTEEMWTTDISNTSADGTKYTFTASYVNYENAQAFLVAFNKAEKNGTVSTLPYQFFGMHYFTPGGTEVFLGSVLAFLMVYNDTYDGTGPGENNIMDPGNENVYYVIPYGVGDLDLFKEDTSYIPQVSSIPVKKLGDGEYEFGMTYKNLYAKVVDGNKAGAFWASLFLPLYIAKFSELTIKYHVHFDKENGKVLAETYYTIGQVDKLWWLGVPVDPVFAENWGISAVHFVSIFNSKYWTVDNADKAIGNLAGGRTRTTEEVRMKVGDQERAFDVGFRGTFDLIDEKNGNTKVREGADAYNLLLGARAADLAFVWWQGAFSAGLMSYLAYGLSDQIQMDYNGPCDLYNRSKHKFWGGAFWYAVAFPGWGGYRVEHDPVLTAYTDFASEAAPQEPGPCQQKIMMVVGMTGIGFFIGKVRFRERYRARGLPPRFR